MYFPSKRDPLFSFMYGGIIGSIALLYLFGGEAGGRQLITYKSVPGYLLSAGIIEIVLWIWFSTGYKIEAGILHIRFGPMRKKIRIEDIRRVEQRYSPFAAPALAVKRLEIYWSEHTITHISPKDEKSFIRLLYKENPNIEINRTLTEGCE
ncbi:PH domain-containing protein [Halobacillus kuroshimensis]|uniref:PH domain-containing protein n=1 Tax=Halobacillus kuroshimensis TaxID=302481 RepID=UPI0004161864|nr:PH domain-containing protein [Halobacillus kuroshimensis]